MIAGKTKLAISIASNTVQLHIFTTRRRIVQGIIIRDNFFIRQHGKDRHDKPTNGRVDIQTNARGMKANIFIGLNVGTVAHGTLLNGQDPSSESPSVKLM